MWLGPRQPQAQQQQRAWVLGPGNNGVYAQPGTYFVVPEQGARAGERV